MESKALNAEQLNSIPHDVMVQMYLQQAEAYKTLMDQNPELKYEVQGHTDSTGSPEANQKLSEKRAQAIVDKLVELGIDESRLTAVGKGQYAPIADNATEEGRAQNRRVVFVAK